MLESGITINGMPIVYKGLMEGVVSGPDSGADPKSLIAYFESQVIGGPDAFVEPVTAIESYTEAVHRKLIREIMAPTFAGIYPTEVASSLGAATAGGPD